MFARTISAHRLPNALLCVESDILPFTRLNFFRDPETCDQSNKIIQFIVHMTWTTAATYRCLCSLMLYWPLSRNLKNAHLFQWLTGAEKAFVRCVLWKAACKCFFDKLLKDSCSSLVFIPITLFHKFFWKHFFFFRPKTWRCQGKTPV